MTREQIKVRIFAVCLALLPELACGASFCAGDSAKEQLAPFLNSPSRIDGEKCALSVNAPHDLADCPLPGGKTRKMSACSCTWRLLDHCAETYLSDKQSYCGSGETSIALSGQASDLQAAAKRLRSAADVESSLAKKLRECIAEAQGAGAEHTKVTEKFRQDQASIEEAVKSVPDPRAILERTCLGGAACGD
jgi:hypothetical protein